MMPRIAPFGLSLALLGTLACLACSSTGVGGPDPTIESNTNWLTVCVQNEDCAGASLCECGVCTVACETVSDCATQQDGSVCAGSSDGSVSELCFSDTTTSPGLCLPGCETHDDCGSGSSCIDGACSGAQNGAIGAACDTQEDCIADLACTEGVCADTSAGCQDESSVCGTRLGDDPNSLFVCEGGVYQPRLDCAYACVELDESRAACVPEPCPIDGFFCGVELGVVPQEGLFECADSGIEFVSECTQCEPGAGASSCGE